MADLKHSGVFIVHSKFKVNKMERAKLNDDRIMSSNLISAFQAECLIVCRLLELDPLSLSKKPY